MLFLAASLTVGGAAAAGLWWLRSRKRSKFGEEGHQQIPEEVSAIVGTKAAPSYHHQLSKSGFSFHAGQKNRPLIECFWGSYETGEAHQQRLVALTSFPGNQHWACGVISSFYLVSQSFVALLRFNRACSFVFCLPNHIQFVSVRCLTFAGQEWHDHMWISGHPFFF